MAVTIDISYTDQDGNPTHDVEVGRAWLLHESQEVTIVAIETETKYPTVLAYKGGGSGFLFDTKQGNRAVVNIGGTGGGVIIAEANRYGMYVVVFSEKLHAEGKLLFERG